MGFVWCLRTQAAAASSSSNLWGVNLLREPRQTASVTRTVRAPLPPPPVSPGPEEQAPCTPQQGAISISGPARRLHDDPQRSRTHHRPAPALSPGFGGGHTWPSNVALGVSPRDR